MNALPLAALMFFAICVAYIAILVAYQFGRLAAYRAAADICDDLIQFYEIKNPGPRVSPGEWVIALNTVSVIFCSLAVSELSRFKLSSKLKPIVVTDLWNG